LLTLRVSWHTNKFSRVSRVVSLVVCRGWRTVV
jgi:hypothetical protein